MTETSRGEYKDGQIIDRDSKDAESVDCDLLSAEQIQEKYDLKNSCRHFTREDHLKLGVDLGHVLHTVLVPTQQNSSKVKHLTQRYINFLHGGLYAVTPFKMT